MAFSRVSCLIRSNSLSRLNFSSTCCLAHKWRLKHGLEANPRQFSPLTQHPDYSFVDGRPRPLSYGEKSRLELQKKYCEKIVEMSHELDVAVQVHKEKLEKEAECKREILRNKLKPKGAALLKQNRNN